MANKTTRNPWIIDTASGTLLRPTGATQAAPQGSPVRIAAVLFSGYTTGNTDKAVLADEDGATFLTLNGTSDKTAVGITFARPVSKLNFSVPTITSGIVTVWMES